MPSPLNIPQRFSAEEPLKGELERQAQEIDKYLRGLADTTAPVPTLGGINQPLMAFGRLTRVNVLDGETLALQLPLPDPANFGKRCGLLRTSTTGQILVYAVGCLVAGAERYRMANDIHVVEFTLAGDYYPSRAGAGS